MADIWSIPGSTPISFRKITPRFCLFIQLFYFIRYIDAVTKFSCASGNWQQRSDASWGEQRNNNIWAGNKQSFCSSLKISKATAVPCGWLLIFFPCAVFIYITQCNMPVLTSLWSEGINETGWRQSSPSIRILFMGHSNWISKFSIIRYWVVHIAPVNSKE